MNTLKIKHKGRSKMTSLNRANCMVLLNQNLLLKSHPKNKINLKKYLNWFSTLVPCFKMILSFQIF